MAAGDTRRTPRPLCRVALISYSMILRSYSDPAPLQKQLWGEDGREHATEVDQQEMFHIGWGWMKAVMLRSGCSPVPGSGQANFPLRQRGGRRELTSLSSPIYPRSCNTTSRITGLSKKRRHPPQRGREPPQAEEQSIPARGQSRPVLGAPRAPACSNAGK